MPNHGIASILEFGISLLERLKFNPTLYMSIIYLLVTSVQLDAWFDLQTNGVNKEARQLNSIIKEAVRGTDLRLLDFTYLSELRADAHPAIWLGKKDAVSIWGQDCMHWCLPGVPDTWVDILSELIRYGFRAEFAHP